MDIKNHILKNVNPEKKTGFFNKKLDLYGKIDLNLATSNYLKKGEWLFVTINNNQVQIYQNIDGSYKPYQKLIYPEMGDNWFGYSIEFNNDLLFISNPVTKNDNSMGSVYVYKIEKKIWKHKETIRSENNIDYLFGFKIRYKFKKLVISSINTKDGKNQLHIYNIKKNKIQYRESLDYNLTSDSIFDYYENIFVVLEKKSKYQISIFDDSVAFLTNKNVIELNQKPEELIVNNNFLFIINENNIPIYNYNDNKKIQIIQPVNVISVKSINNNLYILDHNHFMGYQFVKKFEKFFYCLNNNYINIDVSNDSIELVGCYQIDQIKLKNSDPFNIFKKIDSKKSIIKKDNKMKIDTTIISKNLIDWKMSRSSGTLVYKKDNDIEFIESEDFDSNNYSINIIESNTNLIQTMLAYQNIINEDIRIAIENNIIVVSYLERKEIEIARILENDTPIETISLDVESFGEIIYFSYPYLFVSAPINRKIFFYNLEETEYWKNPKIISSESDNEILFGTIINFHKDYLVLISLTEENNIISFYQYKSNNFYLIKNISTNETINHIHQTEKFIGILNSDKNIILYYKNNNDLIPANNLEADENEKIIDFRMIDSKLFMIYKSVNKSYLGYFKFSSNGFFEINTIESDFDYNLLDIGSRFISWGNKDEIKLYQLNNEKIVELQSYKDPNKINKMIMSNNQLLTVTDQKEIKVLNLPPQFNYSENGTVLGVNFQKIEIEGWQWDKLILLFSGSYYDTMIFTFKNQDNEILSTQVYKWSEICSDCDTSHLLVGISVFLEDKINNKLKLVVSTKENNTNLTFSGYLQGKFNKDSLPCFLPGTLVKTENGEKQIELLEEGELILNEKNELVSLTKLNKWIALEYNKLTTPYLIKKNTLEYNYPNRDTYVSGYHSILLPSGDMTKVFQIKLPEIKQINPRNEPIIYYNLILPNKSNFYANNMIVESLDPSNKNLY